MTPAQRNQLMRELRAEARRIMARHAPDERTRRLQLGTVQPANVAEQIIYDLGVKRREKRLARPRPEPAKDPRPAVEPIDLDNL